MLNFILRDGWGSGNKAKVNGEGEVSTVVHPHPPKDEREAPRPFRQYFTDTGLITGDNDMRVDGSTTPQTFSICADTERDTYIYSASVLISDAGAGLNEFANLPALTNGLDLEWFNRVDGSVVIADNITTNFELVRLGLGSPPIGGTTDAFRANNVSGASEGYIPFIEFNRLFGLPWGIRLKKGTEDKLLWRINDDLSSGITEFNIIAFGIRF